MEFMCKSQIIESLLKKIFQTVERILANSETITSPSFYLLTPSGMERLESTCMLLIAIGEGVKGVDKITDKKLLKVFIYDYLDIYPNDDNRMDQLPCIILKIFTYFKFFLAFLFLMVGNMYLFIIINSFLQYGMDNGFISSFTSNIRRIDCFEILRAVICYGLYVAVIFWAKNSNIDRYTTRKKKIEKMICRKVKAYDKRNDKYVY